MSVDYYTCNHCGKIFSDCGYYISCEGCGTLWCSDKCAEKDGYIREHCSKYSALDNRNLMEDYRERHCNYDNCYDCEYYCGESCKYCRKEDYDDLTLLNKALNLLNINRKELVNIINNKNKRYCINCNNTETMGKALKIVSERLKNTKLNESSKEPEELKHVCSNCKYHHMVEHYDQQWGLIFIGESWCDKDKNLMSTFYSEGNDKHYNEECKFFEYGKGVLEKWDET